MTYRPGRYRAGGRHEDKEEVRRKKEEVRTDFDLDLGARQRTAESVARMNASGGTYATVRIVASLKTANFQCRGEIRLCARVGNTIHAAHFHFRFLHGFLAVPQRDWTSGVCRSSFLLRRGDRTQPIRRGREKRKRLCVNGKISPNIRLAYCMLR